MILGSLKAMKNEKKENAQNLEKMTEEVLRACKICFPKTTEFAKDVMQSDFDKIMSQHLQEVHQEWVQIFSWIPIFFILTGGRSNLYGPGILFS